MSDDDRTVTREELQRQMSADPPADTVTLRINDGDPITLAPGRLTIGRSPGVAAGVVHAITGDPLVSKEHLAIEVDAVSGAVTVSDLGSSNGSFVDGSPRVRLTEVPVAVGEGTVLLFGDQRAVLSIDVTAARVPSVSDDAPAQEPDEAASTTPPPFAASGDDSSGMEVIDVSSLPSMDSVMQLSDDADAPSPWMPSGPRDQAADPAEAAAAAPLPEIQSLDEDLTGVRPPSSTPAPVDPASSNPLPSGGDTWYGAAATATPAAPIGMPVPPTQPAGPAGPPEAGSSPTSCTSCGAPLVPGARFCESCGTPVIGAAPPSAAGGPAWDQTSGETAQQSASPSDNRIRNLALVALAVALVGGAVYFLVLRGDDSSSASGLPAAPNSEPEEIWQEGVDRADTVAADGRNVYVGSDDDNELVVAALSRDDGSEAWETDVEPRGDFSSGGLLAAVDGVVVVFVCDFDGCELHGLDADDGEALWDDGLSDDVQDVYVESGILYVEEFDRVTILEPSTGDSVVSVSGDRVEPRGAFVYAFELDEDSDGRSFYDEAEVFDARTLESVADPLKGDEDYTLASYVFDGDRWLVAEEDTILMFDKQGEEIGSSRTSIDFITTIVPVGGGKYVASGDGDVVGLKPDDGRADEMWDADGSVAGALVVSGDVLVRVVDGDDLEIRNGESGEVIYDGDSNEEVLPASNAVVVGEYRPDRDEWDGESINPRTGDTNWSLEVDGRPTVVDRGIVALNDDDDITLYE